MKIENLCVKYDKNIVIENFSLNLTLGEKVIIYGPNGTGKTTLLKTILGIVKAASGKIIFEDNEIIAYCKQDYPNPEFPITVEEVVAMGIKKQNKNSKEDIKNALIKANALNLQGRLFYSLSGGERQKVSLARCYCQNANLFLLDEPSSFLDTKSKNIFLEQMKNLENQNCSVIAVTHDEELIKNLNWKVIKWNK
ncbi:MAG: ATP-binding cassette domain-containing protein [Treponema bryantii]|nr:ATP-binding cassette domain-containing protein [Treponema bryantii]